MSKVTVHDFYVEIVKHQIHMEELQRWCKIPNDEMRELHHVLSYAPIQSSGYVLC
jgi:hypothetical protein